MPLVVHQEEEEYQHPSALVLNTMAAALKGSGGFEIKTLDADAGKILGQLGADTATTRAIVWDVTVTATGDARSRLQLALRATTNASIDERHLGTRLREIARQILKVALPKLLAAAGARAAKVSASPPAATIDTAAPAAPPAAPALSSSPKGMWDDTQYAWVVICKNSWYRHSWQAWWVGHKIPLGQTDAIETMPIKGPIAVRCDDCKKEYSYAPDEVMKASHELPASFTPHPHFR
jgi:hypothetical protein